MTGRTLQGAHTEVWVQGAGGNGGVLSGAWLCTPHTKCGHKASYQSCQEGERTRGLGGV